MNLPQPVPKRESGVVLLEALISILIFSVGILSVVAMQGVALKNVTEAKYRTEAAFLVNDLLATIWADAANITAYAYPGSGGVPARLTTWKAKIDALLPGAASVPPIVAISGNTTLGGTVDITVRWLPPEQASLGLPPRNHRVIASVFINP